ncbi:MAG TPA: phosphoribosylaminoimidazolesuccinocarboxamide synthase [bacterium]|nr:phosphoribosylaminoimidazolesuccinocarboxamide synthase [bacterium]
MVDVGKFKTIYTGSVKNLRLKKAVTANKPGVLLFEFTDDYSIFDYGKMPDRIPGKGATAAISSAYFFERASSAAAWKELAKAEVWNTLRQPQLRDELLASAAFKLLKRAGMPTHYRGILNHKGQTVTLDKLTEPSNVIEVAAVNIVHPQPLPFGGVRVWNYNHIHPAMKNILVPLECVFRFGMPTGSSLTKRLERIPDYHKQLGLNKTPREGQMFSRPVVEYFSKLEPADRYLPYEWALNIAGLTNEQFLTVTHYTLLLAMFLKHEFAKAQVTLWDGKFEFLRTDAITLGDAITPDELRLTMRGVQISKEPIRQYYRKHEPKFVAAMDRAKDIAQKVDKPLAKIVNDDLKCPPPKMDPKFHAAVADMFIGLTEAVCRTGLFGAAPSLPKVMKTFAEFGIA